MKLIDNIIQKTKKKFYGKTFFCPVCHLELSEHDVNEDGLLVCPLCGIVIEYTKACGHSVPVVHGVEIKRHQTKARIHPISTHIPIGLFPFAVLGSLFLLLTSLSHWFLTQFEINPVLESLVVLLMKFSPSVSKATFFIVVISVFFSLITFASGLWDWNYRYEKRRYRSITLKIYFSALYCIIGVLLTILLSENVVFSGSNGLIPLSFTHLISAFFYYVLLGLNMIILATLGHVGGLLVLVR